MKICYIANSASSHTEKWVEYFLSRGHEVHVISHSNIEIPGAQVHFINYSIKNFPFMSAKVHKKIAEINPDILHAHQANTCGLYAATAKGYKYILSAWGSDILVGPDKSVLLKKIASLSIKGAAYVTSDSYYMSDKILELGGISDRVYTFPMGIEDDCIKEKRIFNTEESKLNIISLRRLEKMFRIDLIIKGFAKAVIERPNMFLDIAASGSEAENLQALAEDLKITDKLKFSGKYDPHQVGALLKENDVFISIPESDSTSVSLLESMYCGLFPVLCDLPANREWVKDKGNGLIIKTIDEDNIAQALIWCYDNKVHMAKASQENINIIEEKALWKNNSKIVEKLYEKMLEVK